MLDLSVRATAHTYSLLSHIFVAASFWQIAEKDTFVTPVSNQQSTVRFFDFRKFWKRKSRNHRRAAMCAGPRRIDFGIGSQLRIEGCEVYSRRTFEPIDDFTCLPRIVPSNQTLKSSKR